MAERLLRRPVARPSLAGWRDAVWAGRRWPQLPLAMLLLALLTLFLWGGGPRGYFYQPGHHDFLSSQSMTLAANLSPEDGFLMFWRHRLDAAGNPEYELYNRFPPGPYAAIKLITLPLGDDFARQIYAARILMLLLFSGAALLAYLSLCRLAGNRWIALTATALAFSSGYGLYYGDMVSSEIASLFGILLVFHAMTVFEQEGRFRQLALKSLFALLLGWHIYALLFPFVVLGLLKEAIGVLRAGSPAAEETEAAPYAALLQWRRLTGAWLRRAAGTLRVSRYLRLGLLTLAFGLLLLAFNLGNEYRAAGGEIPLTQLPTVESALLRAGIRPDISSIIAAEEKYEAIPYWALFFREQFAAIGIMSVPAALPTYRSIADLDANWNRSFHERQTFYTGIAALGGAILGLLLLRPRRLLAALLLAGFCWSVALRGSSIGHDFEGLFYIGIPLAAVAGALLWVRSLARERLMAALGCAAVLLFVFSAFQMKRLDAADAAAVRAPQFQQEVMDDFRAIRPITTGKSVFVPLGQDEVIELAGAPLGLHYYLAGSALVLNERQERRHRDRVDFFLMDEREPGPALLTPDNRRVFLYDRAEYDAQAGRLIGQAGAPVVRGPFQVYYHDHTLVYLKDGCAPGDAEPGFMLHLTPAAVDDLPEWTRARGFHNLDFAFDDHRVAGGPARCIALVRLPGYAVSSIRTGQFLIHPDGRFETLWEETFAVAAE